MPRTDIDLIAVTSLSDMDLVAVRAIMVAMHPQNPDAAVPAIMAPGGATDYVLVRVAGHPAGAVRLRWGEGIVTLEKISVLPEFRNGRVLRELFQTALKLAEAKGCDRIEAQVRKRHVAAWERLFGAVRSGKPVLVEGAIAYPVRCNLPAPVV